MATKRQAALRKKYPAEKMTEIRAKFKRDREEWKPIQTEAALDRQCTSTEQGPWPDAEWRSRHTAGQERPCLHEDVLTQFKDQVINQMSMNPMGVDVEPQDENTNQDTAEFHEGRIRQIEYEQHGQLAYMSAVAPAVGSSYGFWELETDTDGDIKGADLQKVLISPVVDPDSIIPGFSKKPDWSDLRQYWKLERMVKAEFFERFGKKAQIRNFSELPADCNGEFEWFTDTHVTVLAWTHLEEDEHELDEDESQEYSDDDDSESEPPTKITRTVLKTLMNGLEVLEETEWLDYEVPLLVVTGRVTYEKGKKKIESLIRKGRVGQLSYDQAISSIQERLAMVPKSKWLGARGQFGEGTDWGNIHRDPVAYIEYEFVIDPTTQQAAPPPQLIEITANTAELEATKQSILIGIQNAIGMSSVERKDRASKSGKALDALTDEMNVATAHYFNALRIAQERSYRILDRLLNKIEGASPRRVPIRTADGKTKMVPASPAMYAGQHSVVITSSKMYQSQQEEDSDFYDSLLKETGSNETIQLAVLPMVIRGKLGTSGGETLAKEIEAMQPPQMQAARNGQPQQDPAVQQAIQKASQHIQLQDQLIQQMKQEKAAEMVKTSAQERMNQDDNRTKIQIAEINASIKESMETLDAQVAHIKNVADVLMGQVQIQHEANQADLDRQHAQQQQEQAAQAAQTQQAQGAQQQQQAAEAAQQNQPAGAE